MIYRIKIDPMKNTTEACHLPEVDEYVGATYESKKDAEGVKSKIKKLMKGVKTPCKVTVEIDKEWRASDKVNKAEARRIAQEAAELKKLKESTEVVPVIEGQDPLAL